MNRIHELEFELAASREAEEDLANEVAARDVRVAELEGETAAWLERDKRILELQAQLERATSESLQLRLPKVWEIQTGEGVSIGLRYENGAMSATEYTEDESGNFEHYRPIELEEHTGSTAQLDRKPAEPRPMSEAPRGGTEFWAMRKASWAITEGAPVDHVWCNDECEEAESYDGWLPTTTASGGSEAPACDICYRRGSKHGPCCPNDPTTKADEQARAESER